MNIRILNDIVEIDYQPVLKFICAEHNIPLYKDILSPDNSELEKARSDGYYNGHDEGYEDGVECGKQEIIDEQTTVLNRLLNDKIITMELHELILKVLPS